MNIAELDENFKAYTQEGVTYTLLEPEQLTLEGFPWEAENQKKYIRLPDKVYINERVKVLSECTAGGVIRLCTDSSVLMLKGRYRPASVTSHMPLTGMAGFDVMLRKNGRDRLLANLHTEVAPLIAEEYDFALSCPLPGTMEEYRIYLPLYAGIESLYIGLSKNARLEAPPAHHVEKPVLFYGSSITQGACASRPSNCHCALLSSWLDAPQINLGFSGNAKGESAMAEAIAGLSLSCFVMDYDFNADIAGLKDTHEPFFKTIRAKHQSLPVVFVTMPYGNGVPLHEVEERRDIIMTTYLNAKSSGDKHVYFVDGMRFFDEPGREAATVDLIHPTDLGFYFMAKHIKPVLQEALRIC